MENQNNNPQYGAPQYGEPQGNPQYGAPQYGAPQGNPQYGAPQYGAPQGNPQYGAPQYGQPQGNPQYSAPQAAPEATPAPKKKNKIVSIISIIVIIISVIVIINALNGPKITKAEYDKIETGMSYSEVCDIIGSEGELQASFGGAAIYSWEGVGMTGANAAITFYNGRVTGKAEAGLN